MPSISSRRPRVVVNAAALTNLVYTGINVAQDMVAGHFGSDDKVFVASFLVGLVMLLVPLAGGEVTNDPSAPATVSVETPEPVKAE